MSEWSVWKVTVDGVGLHDVSVPKGAEFLSVGLQGDKIVVWFGCDTTQPVEKRELIVCMTGLGAPSPDRARFLGTITRDAPSGEYVLHVFVRRRQ